MAGGRSKKKKVQGEAIFVFRLMIMMDIYLDFKSRIPKIQSQLAPLGFPKPSADKI